MNPFDPKLIESVKLDRVARELELQECTEKSIEIVKEFCMRLEMEHQTTRCLTIYALHKTYTTLFPGIFEAIKKLGV